MTTTTPTLNGPKPTLEVRLADIEGKLATAAKFWRRSCFQRHVEGRLDALNALRQNKRVIADLEREREELQAALSEVAEQAQTAQARQAAKDDLVNRFVVVKRLRVEGAQALRDGRQGAELWPTLQERDLETCALASDLHPITGLPEHRASSIPPLRSLLGEELSEVYGLVKRVASGDLVAIRRSPSPPRTWPWSPLVAIARGEMTP